MIAVEEPGFVVPVQRVVGGAEAPGRVHSHGCNPIPNGHLSSLPTNIAEHHRTAGAAWRPRENAHLGLSWRF